MTPRLTILKGSEMKYATPSQRIRAMEHGLLAISLLATQGPLISRHAWRRRAKVVKEVLRRTKFQLENGI
jgi:hypothetical protein